MTCCMSGASTSARRRQGFGETALARCLPLTSPRRVTSRTVPAKGGLTIKSTGLPLVDEGLGQIRLFRVATPYS